jgi:Glyoxalase-like domain
MQHAVGVRLWPDGGTWPREADVAPGNGMRITVPGGRAAQDGAREHRPARPAIARLPRGPLSADVGPRSGLGRVFVGGAGQERPQQVHLDLVVDRHEEAAQRAVALGATRLAGGATWITLADPAGHPFCLSIP